MPTSNHLLADDPILIGLFSLIFLKYSLNYFSNLDHESIVHREKDVNHAKAKAVRDKEKFCILI
jgi:hypothetical protein